MIKGDLTFDEWVEHGYRVRKGEKTSGRNKKGQPTFSIKQVWFVPENKRSIYLSPTESSNKPLAEIQRKIETRARDEETRHSHIDDSFDVTEQIFNEDEEPPW